MISKKIKMFAMQLINKTISFFTFPIEFLLFRRRLDDDRQFGMEWSDIYPCLNDKTKQTSFDRHYVYHTAWAVRKVKEINPLFHIDISSSLYFSSILSAFIPVRFYDYRPADLKLSGLKSKHTDLTRLHFKSSSIKSLSCMHTVEHIGLGRYGDHLDTEGDLKAIEELKRVVAPKGNLLFVVPIGKEAKIMFNAHRIYTYSMVLKYFHGFVLKEFALIPENNVDGGLIKNPNSRLLKKQKYACGCFWFIKK